ncbi:hypothetical protein RKD47_006266 [Streptomyces albogriseolus]
MPYGLADPAAHPGRLRGGHWPDKPGMGEPTGHHSAALAQRPRPGLLQRPFRTGGFRSRVKPLLAKERFSI